jgi:hypothetical protein
LNDGSEGTVKSTLMSKSAPAVARVEERGWKSRVKTGLLSCQLIWTVPPFIFDLRSNWIREFRVYTYRVKCRNLETEVRERKKGNLALLVFPRREKRSFYCSFGPSLGLQFLSLFEEYYFSHPMPFLARPIFFPKLPSEFSGFYNPEWCFSRIFLILSFLLLWNWLCTSYRF